MDPYYQDIEINPSYYEGTNFHNSSIPSAANVIGSTVSVTPTARMKTYGVATVPQQTRHARRIYVGGIPANYIDEDGLRTFMNSVIAQGLGEENDHSYVLSVYINQKKCFAFVELKSIELASACLELDGIIMKNVVLRILRANEYKPELIPQSLNKTVHFDLSGFQFGSTAGTSGWNQETDDSFHERTLESVIQFTNLGGLEPGSVTIVGFPYDESQRKASIRGAGCSNTPKQFRAFVRKYKYGFVDNPEFEVDISKLKVLDVGDVLAGKTAEETKGNLTTTVTELILRGSVPFVIGGSIDLSVFSISGLLSGSGNRIAVVYVSAHGDLKILEDSRFYGTRNNIPLTTCQGRYIVFGAQGSDYSRDEANYIRDRGGRFVWLTKDLKTRNCSVTESFAELLKEINRHDEASPIPIALTIDASVLTGSLAPHANNTHSPQGLNYDDLVGIARVAGADPSVVLLNVTEFSASTDENRCNTILVDVFYHFLLGFANRREEIDRKTGVSIVASSFSQREIKNLNSDLSSSPSFLQKKSYIESSQNKPDEIRIRSQHLQSSDQIEAYSSSSAHPPRSFRGPIEQLWTNSASSSGVAYPSPIQLNKSQLSLEPPQKLAQSLSDLSRNPPRTSTMSSMSSSTSLANRSSSSYGSARSVGSFSYSTVSGVVRSGGLQSPGGQPFHNQSIPDIISDLHAFDESLDLGEVPKKGYDNSKGSVAAPSQDSVVTIPYSTMTLPLESQISPRPNPHPINYTREDLGPLESENH